MNSLTGMLSVANSNCAENADTISAEGSAESTCSYIVLFSEAAFGALKRLELCCCVRL